MKRNVDELEKHGFIQRSASPFASVPVMAPKKKDENGKVIEWRMCIDSRKLNSITISDRYPIPNIHSLFPRFKKYFSSLDLRCGFHHCAIRPEDRYKTAFLTPWGLYEWIRMSFGYKNAPAAFQRSMDYIFRDMEFVIVYVDDILIMSYTLDEHIQHIEKVLDRIRTYNLKLRLDKCEFLKKELVYVGWQINEHGTKPDPEYISKLFRIPSPKTLPQVRRLIGMLQWLHRYIPR